MRWATGGRLRESVPARWRTRVQDVALWSTVERSSVEVSGGRRREGLTPGLPEVPPAGG